MRALPPTAHRPFLFLRLLSVAVLLAATAGAEVVRFEELSRRPLAQGASFGEAGPYEALTGRLHFALDPTAEANQAIVDLEHAPKAKDGKVRFHADLYLLRPVDAKRGNGTVLFEIPNRGGKTLHHLFQRDGRNSLDPLRAEDHGDALLLRSGFTLAWVGWQQDLPRRKGLLGMQRVEAKSGLEGRVRADHVFNDPADVLPLGHRGHQAYPVANLDDPKNLLTVRDRSTGPREVLPRDRWSFARIANGQPVPDPRWVHLEGGFTPGRIYEVVYTAKDPAVAGLGLAAVRDAAVSFRQEGSPARGQRVLGIGFSQSGRFLRQLLHQGFQVDAQGRAAFDGLFVHAAGGGRGSFNHRFAQPSRDGHPFSAFLYPTDLFPFTPQTQRDPATGREDGLLAQVPAAKHPKVVFTNTSYEYWGRAAALTHTTPDGKSDLPPPDGVRLYHLAGSQHFVEAFPPPSPGTRHAANPHDFTYTLRALLLALDGWTRGQSEPPPSRFPRLADKTLVSPDQLNFPTLPAIEPPRDGLQAWRPDFGPHFPTRGLITHQPPKPGQPFPLLVPQVDPDGNELGGLHLPQLALPTATYTGWNYRSEKAGAGHQLATFRGSFLPFPPTPEAARRAGDPRASLAERYGGREAYRSKVEGEARKLVKAGYLLEEDVSALVEEALTVYDAVAGGAVKMPRAVRRAAGAL